MRMFVLCENSGTIRNAFARVGWDATSIDILPTEDPRGKHIQGDIFSPEIERLWSQADLIIANPPCTDLTIACTGLWAEKIADGRMGTALEFVRRLLYDYPHIPRMCIENPVGAISTKLPNPDGTFGYKSTQIIQPWQFGHHEYKRTALWLRGLDKLEHTEITPVELRNHTLQNLAPSPDRWKIRSKTFEGVSSAMAQQWG